MSTVAVSLMILGLSLILVVNSNYLATTIESELEIAVILKDDVSGSQLKTVYDKLRTEPMIEHVVYVSKAEALSQMRKQLGERSDFFRALGDQNPLPDLFRIKVKDVAQVAAVAEQISAYSGVDKVRYGQGVIERLLSLTYWVRWVGVGVMGLIGAAAVFLIATTIRLTVFARRKEINIMKYVGATDWFIRWPFLLEGTLLGLLGALIAVAMTYGLYMQVVSYVHASLPFVPLRNDADFLLLLTQVLLGTGMFIGALGSLISLRRFLRV